MNFKYYITNTFNGNVEGTNDEEKVKELAQCDEYFVVDAETGEWLVDDRKIDIEEMQ